MRTRAFACALLLAGVAGVCAGGYDSTAPVEPNSGVKIRVSSPFQYVPPAGYMPLTITVTNDTDRDRAWRMRTSQQLFGRAGGASGAFVFPVRARSERSFDVLAPLGSRPTAPGYVSPLSLGFSGYACSSGYMSISGTSGGGGAPKALAFTGVSAEVSKFWGEVKSVLKSKHSVDFEGVELDAGGFPTDWRAYAGFDRVWLTEPELRALAPLQRTALEGWVAYGGDLVVVTRGAALENRPKGFGRLWTVPFEGDKVDIEDAASLTMVTRPVLAARATDPDLTSWVEKRLDKPAVNVPLLTAFIVGLAVVMGPVNLFVFAPARRRQRLFWTTPLISIVASAGAWGVILVQDGVGGWGVRDAVILVTPETHEAVLLQAQAARTGVVWRSAFTVSEPVVLHQIAAQSWPNVPSTTEVAGTFSGDFFRNRSAQGQVIAAVRPTRGAMQWVNSDAAEEEPPILLSSFDVELSRVDFHDKSGGWWTAGPVTPGQRVTCRRVQSPGAELPFPQGAMCPTLSGLIAEAKSREGYFFAEGAAPDGGLIETLSSIRWRKPNVLVLGPVVP